MTPVASLTYAFPAYCSILFFVYRCG
jgi:hypothetical protein